MIFYAPAVCRVPPFHLFDPQYTSAFWGSDYPNGTPHLALQTTWCLMETIVEHLDIQMP
jgi:hypothetical protein